MSLEEKIQQWMSKADSKESEDYYFGEIFPQIIENFLKKGEYLEKKNYEYIISLVGFTAEPIILFHKLFHPKKHYFICSKETENTVDIIVTYEDLLPSHYEKKVVNSSDTAEIYRALKDVTKGIEPSNTLIDITGGKKSMSGAASLVGGLLSIDLGYVDYDKYFREKRKPYPGTEFPVILDNPLNIFGEEKISDARKYFNLHQFEKAYEIFDELEKILDDVGEVKRLKEITQIYMHWNNFEINEALLEIESLSENPSFKKLGVYFLETLKRHKVTLEKLQDALSKNPKEENLLSLPLNFYFTAKRYEDLGKHDIAVFIAYRGIESISQMRLREYGILVNKKVSKENYEKLGITSEKFKETVRMLYKEEYYEKDLPTKIALMDGYVILSILEDKVMNGVKLEEILDATKLRNKSIFAHGTVPLKEEDFKKINRVFSRLLIKCLGEDKKENLVTKHEQEFTFPTL